MAIKRHEFHPQFGVASATTSIEAGPDMVAASASPSLIAPVRGTTARSAVATVQRPSVPAHVVACTAGATSSHHKICVLTADTRAVTRLACPATPRHAVLQASRYVCLLEAA